MPSFGEKLKLEREKRAIALEEISLSTKIGKRMLQALEEGKFDQLPGGIFNKGFVRAYARHVGLDEEQAVADYLEASGEGPTPKTDAAAADAEAPVAEPSEPAPSRQRPWGLFAAILLVVALALFVWSRRQHKDEGQPGQSPPAETQKPVPASGSSTGSKSSLSDGGATRVSAPTKTEVSPSPALSAAGGKDAAPIASAITPAASRPAPGEFTVVILAREDSWLSIIADGNTIFEDTLVAENQRAVHGQKEVVIKAGNTGALDFVFNGKKLNPQGDYGEVKTLTFGSGGLLPNPSSPPVTQ